MPKQTFFNLPIEKQQLLIDAAKKEFSRVPFNESSISNIVKNACIPRGSFYQYFENKEDAFYFLLEEQTKVHNNEFMMLLIENNGDIFEAFIGTFRSMLTGFQEKDNRGFFKNAFLNMDYKMERKLSKGFRFNNDHFNKQYPNFIKNIDQSNINIENKDELVYVMQIIMAVTLQNLMNHFAKKHTIEEALQKYKIEIDLLKRGLLKNSF